MQVECVYVVYVRAWASYVFRSTLIVQPGVAFQEIYGILQFPEDSYANKTELCEPPVAFLGRDDGLSATFQKPMTIRFDCRSV